MYRLTTESSSVFVFDVSRLQLTEMLIQDIPTGVSDRECMFIQTSITHNKLFLDAILATSFGSK
jgi:hypothetical protein